MKYLRNNIKSYFYSFIVVFTFLLLSGCSHNDTLKEVAPISNLSATWDQDSEVTLSWQRDSNHNSCIIYRKTSEQGNYIELSRTDTNSYIDNDIPEGTTCSYYVIAKDIYDNESLQSEPVSIFITYSSPDFIITGKTGNSVTLNWLAIPDAVSYTIEVSANEVVSYTELATVPDLSYTHSNLKKQIYYYKISANFTEETGPKCKPFKVDLGSLEAPENLTVTEKTGNSVTLSWQEVPDAENYTIEVSADEVVSYTTLTTVEDLYYTHSDLDRQVYYYKVYATVFGEKTPLSNPLKVDLGLLEAPENLNITENIDNVTLSWKAVEGAYKYNIYKYQFDDTNPDLIGVVSDTPFSDTNVSETSKNYMISAVRKNDDTEGYMSNRVSGSRYVISSPENVKLLHNSDGTLTLSWDAVDKADRYHVYRDNSSYGISGIDSIFIGEVKTELQIDLLTEDLDHVWICFGVKAINTEDATEFSEVYFKHP